MESYTAIGVPFLQPSFNRDRYVLTFINEFSRYTWIYFLKQKFEIFANFLDLKSFAKKQFKKFIKILCVDNGGEYVDN